ncbi:MAG: phosphatidylglycerophosphatase A [Bacteroidota bacterium]
MTLPRIISTGFGIGYFGKGGGTLAAIASCLVWHFTGGNNLFIACAVTFFVTGIGVWSADKVEAEWGVDSSRVVIDEIAGMCVSLLFLPITPTVIVAGLILFRFFDIVKPLYIRRTEQLPGGWGVMADDILAGIYTNIILQVAVKFSVL